MITTRPTSRMRRVATASRRVAAALAAVALICVTAACGASHPSTPTVTPPATVRLGVASGTPGTYLVDGSGRALYLWDADRRGPSTCYGKCAAAWPPVLVAGSATAGPGVNGTLIGTTTRTDGTHQVTYGGWPLYHYAPDALPGQLSGQGNTGFGAVWWLVQPDGTPLASEPVGTTSTPPADTTG